MEYGLNQFHLDRSERRNTLSNRSLIHVLESAIKPQQIFFDHKLELTKRLLTDVNTYNCPSDVVEAAAELFDIRLDERLDSKTIGRLKSSFRSQESKEITSRLPYFHAHKYTEQVFKYIVGSRKSTSYRELMLSVANLYLETMTHLTPLLMKFVEHVILKCETSDEGIKRIMVLATDANVLFVVGRIVGEQMGYTGRLELVELNRRILGIKDEFVALADKNDRELFKHMQQYLDSRAHRYLVSLLYGGPVAIVDVGVYGTIVYVLKKLCWDPHVFFVVSKNPYIEGYVNTVDGIEDPRMEIPMNLGGKIADAIEALPRAYARVRLSSEEKVLLLQSDELDAFYAACGVLVCWAASKHAENRDVNTIITQHEIRNLAMLSRKACFDVSLPLLMEKQTPKWSHAEWFMRQWEKEGIGYVKPRIGLDPT